MHNHEKHLHNFQEKCMASDSLLTVIQGLVKRDGRIAKEDAKKAKEAVKAQKEQEDEEDEDEEPVGEPADNQPPADEPPPEEGEDEEGEEEDEEEGDYDNKVSGPDPALVQQVSQIVMQQIQDMLQAADDAQKDRTKDDIKLSGKKEKIDTKPKMEQIVTRRERMNFQEAIRLAVTDTHLEEGYESVVLDILEDEGIDGPLGYEPFFEKGKLYVEKGSEKKAAKVLKNSKDIRKVPKIVGEELSEEEYLQMESVAVDGRLKGFREALKRLTYEKIKAMKAKEEVKKEHLNAGLGKEGVEKDTKGDGDEYQKFFKAALKKFGVDEPDQLEGDKKKEFFDYVDKNWKADNEKPEPEDKKEEVDIEEMRDILQNMDIDQLTDDIIEKATKLVQKAKK